MLIYDIEIENAILGRNETPKPHISYCEGFHDFKNMGIACIGVYDMVGERARVFLKDNLREFEKLFLSHDCVIGFNNKRFDDRLLIANGLTIPVGRSYDILEEIWRGLGLPLEFNYKTHGGLGLNDFAFANFGIKKTGSGATAPIDWQEKRQGAVIDYCLADVELTRRLLMRIINRGNLKHPKTGELIKIRKPSPDV